MQTDMHDEGAAPSWFLLASFADFYEEVASIKLASQRGELASLLASADGKPPAHPREFAARVCGRLEALLRRQAAEVRRLRTATEARMHSLAQYVMAAVADEILILDLPWPGSEAWLDYLLEYRLFRTNNAGTGLFECADRLLHARQRSELHADLAAVLLLALQLGFKGQYRGPENEAALQRYRELLRRCSEHERCRGTDGPAFAQAYRHTLAGEADQRLAPLSRWKLAFFIVVGAWLAVSTVVWAVSLYPFVKAFGA